MAFVGYPDDVLAQKLQEKFPQDWQQRLDQAKARRDATVAYQKAYGTPATVDPTPPPDTGRVPAAGPVLPGGGRGRPRLPPELLTERSIAPAAEAPQSDQSRSSLARLTDYFSDVPSAIGRGLSRSTGATYLRKAGFTIPEYPPTKDAGLGTRVAEGIGTMAGDPYLDALMVSGGGIPAALGLMGVSGEESARLAAEKANQPFTGMDALTAGGLGAATGVAMGGLGRLGRLATPALPAAGELAGEAAGMAGVGTGGGDILRGERDPNKIAGDVGESFLEGVPTLGILKGAGRVFGGPSTGPVNETGEAVPGKGAGSTPPAESPVPEPPTEAMGPPPPTPEQNVADAYQESTQQPGGYADFRQRQDYATKIAQAYRQSLQAGDYPARAMQSLQAQPPPPDPQTQVNMMALGLKQGQAALAQAEANGDVAQAQAIREELNNIQVQRNALVDQLQRDAGEQAAAEPPSDPNESPPPGEPQPHTPSGQPGPGQGAAQLPPPAQAAPGPADLAGAPPMPGEPSPPSPAPGTAPEPSQGPSGGIPSGVPDQLAAPAEPTPPPTPPPGPADQYGAAKVMARARTNKNLKALEKQEQALFDQIDEAKARGDEAAVQAAHATLAKIAPQLDALRQHLAPPPVPPPGPPGEPVAAEPEAPPPPNAEPPTPDVAPAPAAAPEERAAAPEEAAPRPSTAPKALTRDDVLGMGPDELEAAHQAQRAHEQNGAVDVFGPEGAKRYERLQRTANSTTDTARADAASHEIAQMEAGLPPAQEQRLFGIGETGFNASELRGMAEAARDYAPGTDLPDEYLLNTVGRELLTGHPETDTTAALRLRGALRALGDRGYTQDVIQRAVTERARREGLSPSDARDLLRSTLEGLQGKPIPERAPETPTQRLIEGAKARRLAPDDLTRIEQAARGPAEETRTSDAIAQEIQREQQALETQRRGEPVTNPPGIPDEALLDTQATPEERQARIDDLTSQLQERLRYPRPVSEVIGGERGLYVQDAGSSPVPLQQIAKENLLGYRKIGPYEALFNPASLSPEDVGALAHTGRLQKFLEPDVPWPSSAPPGQILSTSRAPNDETTATRIAQTTPGGAKGRPGEKGMVRFGSEPPMDPTLSVPTLEAKFTRAKGFAERGLDALKTYQGHVRDTFGRIFSYEDAVAPRRFKNDPLYKDDLGTIKLLQEKLELQSSAKQKGWDWATREMARFTQPILDGSYLHRHVEIKALKRLIGLADMIADGGDGEHDLKTLQDQYNRLSSRSTPRVKEAYTQYQTVMRELAEDGIERGWFGPGVLKRSTYFPHLIEDMGRAIGSLYNGLPHELKETFQGWRQLREGRQVTYDNMMNTIFKRLMQHRIAADLEDFARDVLPLVDALPKMDAATKGEFLGSTDPEEIQRIYKAGDSPKEIVTIQGDDGKWYAYHPYSFLGSKFGDLVPQNIEQTVVADAYNRRQDLARVHWLPTDVAKRFESFVRPADVTELGQDYARFQRANRRFVMVGRGLKGVAVDAITDWADYYRDLGLEDIRSVGRFSKELAQYVGSFGKKPPPLVVRALSGTLWGPETPREQQFIAMTQHQELGESTFYGNPTEHILGRKLAAAEMPLAERLATLPQRTLGRAMDEFQKLPQALAALPKGLKAEADFQRALKGKPPKTQAIDVAGLPWDYAIGKAARGLSQNYQRIPPVFQRWFSELWLNFMGWRQQEVKNWGRWANQTVFGLPVAQKLGAALRGDVSQALPVLESYLKFGVPLYMLYRERQKFQDFSRNLVAAESYLTNSIFWAPTKQLNDLGQRMVFAPSTGLDLAPQIFLARNIQPALKEYGAGKSTIPEFLRRIVTDPLSAATDEVIGSNTWLTSIPIGLWTNKKMDGTDIVPTGPGYEGLEHTWEGMRDYQLPWMTDQVLMALGRWNQDVERAKRDPRTAPGPVAAWMSAAMQRLDPRNAILFPVDQETLPLQAQLTKIESHVPEEAAARYRMDKAVASEMSGSAGAVKAELDDEMERMQRGVLPPPDLGKPTTHQLLMIWQKKRDTATNPQDRAEAVDLIKQMKQLALMERLVRAQKEHPAAAARAMEELNP